MDHIPSAFISQMSMYKTSDNLPSRARTSYQSARKHPISVSSINRSRQISQELKKATETRLLKEIARPKILIEDVSIDKPKKPSFYIEKARQNYISKSANNSKVTSISDRTKMFGPLLSREIAKSQVHFNSCSETNLSNYQTFLYDIQNRPQTSKTVINDQTNCYPNWLINRNDFQSAYKKMSDFKDSDLEHIVSLHPSQRMEDEKFALHGWLASTKFFSKLPKVIVKESCDKLFKETYKTGE